jgi:hypothetical protein
MIVTWQPSSMEAAVVAQQQHASPAWLDDFKEGTIESTAMVLAAALLENDLANMFCAGITDGIIHYQCWCCCDGPAHHPNIAAQHRRSPTYGQFVF